MSSLSAFLQGTTGLALLPPPPLGWVRALSKRSGAGYFLMKGHQIFEPTVDENEAAQHSSFVRKARARASGVMQPEDTWDASANCSLYCYVGGGSTY